MDLLPCYYLGLESVKDYDNIYIYIYIYIWLDVVSCIDIKSGITEG